MDRKTAIPTVVPFGAGEYRVKMTKQWTIDLALFPAEQSVGGPTLSSSEEEPARDVFFVRDTDPDLAGIPRSAISSYSRTR